MREPRIVEEDTEPHSNEEAPVKRAAREHVTISLSMRTLAIVFGIVVAVWIVQTLSSTLLIFAGAILLATAIDKPATWLQTRGLPRGLGILAVYAIVIAMLTVVVIVLIPLVDNEATRFTNQLSDYQTQFQHLLARFGVHTNLNSHITADQITSKVSGNVNSIVTQLTSITLGIGHAAVVFFAILVISFLLAMDPTAGTRFMKRFLTDDAHARMTRVSGDIHERIGGWVRGQLLVAISFGALFGIGLWAVGIPYAASIGLAAAVLEMIPYLGGAITVIIASAIALTIGIPETIIVIVLYAVLVNVESHILAPKFIGNAVGLPSVVVLAALFIGLETKGIVGVLLAVPASLVITAILDELWPGPEQDKSDSARTSPSLADRMRAFVARFTHPA
ncbi:MAG: AI-2E family transporter [Thermomicrobiales bacterium]